MREQADREKTDFRLTITAQQQEIKANRERLAIVETQAELYGDMHFECF